MKYYTVSLINPHFNIEVVNYRIKAENPTDAAGKGNELFIVLGYNTADFDIRVTW